MIKIFYCNSCNRTFFFSRRTDTLCRRCSKNTIEIDLSFIEFSDLDEKQRKKYLAKYKKP